MNVCKSCNLGTLENNVSLCLLRDKLMKNYNFDPLS